MLHIHITLFPEFDLHAARYEISEAASLWSAETTNPPDEPLETILWQLAHDMCRRHDDGTWTTVDAVPPRRAAALRRICAAHSAVEDMA